jgi:hypothetical protein
MTHSFSSRVTAAPDVLSRPVGLETVLLNLNTETYLGLDTVGTRMWDALMSANSIQAVHDALVEEYEVEATRLREDLEDFLNNLFALGLIEILPEKDVASGESR